MPWSGLSEGSWFSLGRAVMSQLPDLDPHRMNQPLKPQTIHSNHIWCHFSDCFPLAKKQVQPGVSLCVCTCVQS